MVAVLENVKDREQLAFGDEGLRVSDEEVEEEELSGIEAVPRETKLELGDDLLDLYFTRLA